MNYYIDMFTEDTWRYKLKTAISGSRERYTRVIQGMEVGDWLLLYHTDIGAWVGILKVTEPPYRNDEPIHNFTDLPWKTPCKFVVALPNEGAVSFQDGKYAIEMAGVTPGIQPRFAPAKLNPAAAEIIVSLIMEAAVEWGDVSPANKRVGTPTSRPPRWAREEIILALDLYVRRGWLDETDPDVIELSHLLNTLNIHEDKGDPARFRNPNGVSMKLANLQSLDPEYTRDGRTGLASASHLDKEIWDEFSDRPEDVRVLAEAIRASAELDVPAAGMESDLADEYAEGRYVYRLHRARERNPEVTKRKKRQAKKTGPLTCEVCGLVPEEVYGENGERAIECHHLLPLSRYERGQKTRLDDLALVCATCHRVLHAGKHPPTVSELHARVSADYRITNQRPSESAFVRQAE